MKRNVVSAEIVEPYAEALMAVAQEHNLTDRLGEDVKLTLNLLQESEELRQFLLNPFVKAETKKAVLQQLTQGQVHDFFSKFLMLLVDRRRIVLLGDICKQYQALLRQLKNTVLAQVVTTVEPTPEQRQAIIQKVKEMTGAAEVELETSLDSDLIGGVIIRVGSQVLDASLRGQLRRLTNSLMRLES